MEDEKVHNVIVFGQTGSGKSSIINMLDCSQNSSTSSGVIGHTFGNTRYETTINHQNFHIYDTNGLNEAERGKIPMKHAIKNLYDLVQSLQGGISLLVFVFRASRINSTSIKNYRMFRETFCNRRVPIVIVITGLEDELNMDQWWDNNSMHFEEYDMKFDGQACVTSSRGKQTETGWTLDEEYEESKEKLRSLITSHVAEEPWDMHSKDWFSLALRQLVIVSEPGSRIYLKLLEKALRDNAGLDKRQAKLEAKRCSKSQYHPSEFASRQPLNTWNPYDLRQLVICLDSSSLANASEQ